MNFRSYIAPLGIAIAAFWGGAALAAASKKKDEGKGGAPADASKKNGAGKSVAVNRLVPKGGSVPIKHTEPSQVAQDWARQRFQTSMDYLKGIGVSDADATAMSLSALAHWSIETGTGDVTTAGANEFNYNVGGIHARDGDQYFDSTDQGKPQKFAAYDTPAQGVGDYWALLASEYSDCLKMLKDKPTDAGWFKCLGQKGYYGGDPATMADAWTKRHDELAPNVDAYKASGVATVKDVPAATTKGKKVNGDDSTKSYGPYSQDQIDALIAKAKTIMTVTGNNPYTFDPGKASIKLQASYDDAGHVTVKVTDKAFYVPYSKIWENIDKIMP